ncbi:hypothetical protein [Phormidium pseudopriestleyi]|uniref:hypothetical protein n=1 Tax=Phormidium pseudopriestleyi TaxID=1759527 RepID=UPI001A902511|nr:hypothetical protein [Phormidium pseudopriestleyi]
MIVNDGVVTRKASQPDAGKRSYAVGNRLRSGPIHAKSSQGRRATATVWLE